jgi:hypothetical protein
MRHQTLCQSQFRAEGSWFEELKKNKHRHDSVFHGQIQKATSALSSTSILLRETHGSTFHATDIIRQLHIECRNTFQASSFKFESSVMARTPSTVSVIIESAIANEAADFLEKYTTLFMNPFSVGFCPLILWRFLRHCLGKIAMTMERHI